MLWSDLASVRPGRFYLLGINPGGRSGPGMPQIREALCAPDGTNHWADQCWMCRAGETCRHLDPATGRLRPEARSKTQKRVCDLLDALGAAPPDVLSTNLAFARSAQLRTLDGAAEWFDRCWPVHQALLRAVRPDWIVMLGYNRTFDLLWRRGTAPKKYDAVEAANAPVARHWRMTLDIGGGDTRDVRVLAVRHPSQQGFNRVGLGGADRYPDELRSFIVAEVLGGRA